MKRQMRRLGGLLAMGLGATLGSACSSSTGSPATATTGGQPGGGTAQTGGSGGDRGGTASASGGLSIDVSVGGNTADPGGCSNSNPLADDDQDGFTREAGDCNDCDPAVNPGALDFPGNHIDEDCNGTADDEPASCDQGLAIEGNDAMDAAKALGLCRQQQGKSWGVVAARWVFPNGEQASRRAPGSDDDIGIGCPNLLPMNPESRGLLPGFGTNVSPQEGKTLVALSTGVARSGAHTPTPPGEGESPSSGMMCTENVAPPGFPKDSPSCPDVKTADEQRVRDAIALELEIKTPTNARAFAFDFDFYTFEWPAFVCSRFNDFFVALLKSSHPSTPADENISFDKLGNSVSVNNGFVEVCDPAIGKGRPGGKLFECALGTSELTGTGFDAPNDPIDFELPSESHAATGWLSTTAAIVPGETIRLRFAIWDMSDEVLDSTVLLDHFVWTVVEPKTPETVRPPKVK